MPHNDNISAGLQLHIPNDSRCQQPHPEENSLDMIPFPDLIADVPNQEQANPTEITLEMNTKPKPEFALWQKRLAKFVIFLVVVGVLSMVDLASLITQFLVLLIRYLMVLKVLMTSYLHQDVNLTEEASRF